MNPDSTEFGAATAFVAQAETLRDEGRVERVLIYNLTSHLRQMFRDEPAWVLEHIRDAEEQVTYADQEEVRRAHIDNLVGYTTIEYEKDLRRQPVFDEGHFQVRQHLAGMLNRGAPQEKLIGVLSDTLEWRAYRIETVSAAEPLGPNDLTLSEIERISLSVDDPDAGERLRNFMERYLARDESRVLTAETLVRDVGLESPVGNSALDGLAQTVTKAMNERPEYAEIVRELWSNLVGYVETVDGEEFDQTTYVNELYVVTLAKLICANILERGALHSDEAELRRILSGDHFQAFGLKNLVEYDYFGWLNHSPYVEELIPLASELQRVLRRFDFDSPASEDLFGRIMAQLAGHSRRLLLGQEFTPPWLARGMAVKLVSDLPIDEHPRFVDMCCGSGPMIVEVIKEATKRLPEPPTLETIREFATGFDIDPLAVLLAKVNWVAATRSFLEPNVDLSIPIYHADSMFAKTPVSEIPSDDGEGSIALSLGGHDVELPRFLVEPEAQTVFDDVIAGCYRLAMDAAKQPEGQEEVSRSLDAAIETLLEFANQGLGDDQVGEVRTMARSLIDAIESLQREGLNGIWAFVLANGYRPELLAGQFNGLISNPPWLALSKIADNPYRDRLREYAERYGINPGGPSHLHTELATTFLLRAVERFLVDGASVCCVLPETVLNGHHHDPFRRGSFSDAQTPVRLDFDELWRVEPGTFKNEAVVLVGRKEEFSYRESYSGRTIGRNGSTQTPFVRIQLGVSRSAWSDRLAGSESETDGVPDLFSRIPFFQGADLMPRTLVFHDLVSRNESEMRAERIDRRSGSGRYLVNEAKKFKEFGLSNTVRRDYVYEALTSAHLGPFVLEDPAFALLPFERGSQGTWQPVGSIALATHRGSQAVFDEILAVLSEDAGEVVSLSDYQESLDYRRKLSLQTFADPTQFLVVYGAGGGKTTCAYRSLGSLNVNRLVIDQTLYFRLVETEDEALYISGALNSEALDRLVAPFQPTGAQGRRHVHTLPLTVTPPYDGSQALHQAVAHATRNLVSEIHEARAREWPSDWFDPNKRLQVRRPRVFSGVASLPSYAAYADACAALYGT